MRKFRKVIKNLARTVLFWLKAYPGDDFVEASEVTHLKFIRAEFW